MRRWFWLAVVSGDRLRWPRWFTLLLASVFVTLLVLGMIYAYVVLHALSERSEQHHVHTHTVR